MSDWATKGTPINVLSSGMLRRVEAAKGNGGQPGLLILLECWFIAAGNGNAFDMGSECGPAKRSELVCKN